MLHYHSEPRILRHPQFDQTQFEVRFLNANDKTVEGIQHKNKKVAGVQWHPESSPGPYDTQFLFDQFVRESMKG